MEREEAAGDVLNLAGRDSPPREAGQISYCKSGRRSTFDEIQISAGMTIIEECML